jgi:hypothetical protein
VAYYQKLRNGERIDEAPGFAFIAVLAGAARWFKRRAIHRHLQKGSAQ